MAAAEDTEPYDKYFHRGQVCSGVCAQCEDVMRNIHVCAEIHAMLSQVRRSCG